MQYWKAGPRTVVQVGGADSKRFLHSFCTADVRAMREGEIREAMILNDRGRLLGLVHLIQRAGSVEINTVPGQGGSLVAHLERFIIREDVTLTDCSDRLEHLFLFGRAGTDLPWPAPGGGDRFLPDSPGIPVEALRGCFAGPGVLLQFPAGRCASVEQMAQQAGFRVATGQELTCHRILARYPFYGVDCGADSLPQELQRDGTAISFTKGCYLGQETVARIDALGHVNRLLVTVRSVGPGEAPPAGTELQDGPAGAAVGKLTSTAAEPDGRWIGLAMVRRPVARAGTILHSAAGPAAVLPPPEDIA